MARAATALAVVVCAAALTASTLAFPARFSDFRAYYCAGSAVLHGTDWARVHPLAECEHGVRSPWQSALPDAITIPAPYPGYAAAAYAPFAALPFAWAIVVWTLAAVLATAAAVRALARRHGLGEAGVAAVVVVPSAIVALPLGQPTPFVFAALVGCGELLVRGRPRAAAALSFVTLLEPHAGVAVWLGLFAACPRARGVLAGGAALLAAGDLAAFGVPHEWAYLRDILPLHAYVNVPEFSQLSLANALWMAGAAREAALAFADLAFVAALVAGVGAGLRLRARFGPAAAVEVPVALAVIVGVHTHLQQLAFAVPLLLTMTAHAAPARRAWPTALTFVLAMPWLIATPLPEAYPAFVVAALVFARDCGVARLGPRLAAGALALVGGACALLVRFPAHDVPLVPVAGNPLAEVAWGRFVDATSIPIAPWYVAGKLPTLAAGVAVLAALALALRAPAGEAAVADGVAAAPA